MTRREQHTALLLMTILLGTAVSCQTTGSRFLSLFGLQKEPIALALVIDADPVQTVAALNPFPRYAALQRAMQDDLGRPVTVEPCFLFQAKSGLESGWYDAAVMTPTHYARLANAEQHRVLATPVDAAGRATHPAYLVVPAGSEFNDPSELAGHVVAFGPGDDALTHHAALLLLRKHGVQRTDLALEPLPVPGSLKHFPIARSVAQSVINGSSHTGFISQLDWETMPTTATEEGLPTRDELRIIGETIALPLKLVVASPKLDQQSASQIRDFLLSAAGEHPAALEPLGIYGYTIPDEEISQTCRSILQSTPDAE